MSVPTATQDTIQHLFPTGCDPRRVALAYGIGLQIPVEDSPIEIGQFRGNALTIARGAADSLHRFMLANPDWVPAGRTGRGGVLYALGTSARRAGSIINDDYRHGIFQYVNGDRIENRWKDHAIAWRLPVAKRRVAICQPYAAHAIAQNLDGAVAIIEHMELRHAATIVVSAPTASWYYPPKTVLLIVGRSDDVAALNLADIHIIARREVPPACAKPRRKRRWQ